MATFQFRAHDRRSNKEIKDSLEASNQAEAIATIKRQGLLPIEVKEIRAKRAKSGAAGAAGKKTGGQVADQGGQNA